MIRMIESYFEHSDPRGHIKGIVNQGEWQEINLIASDAGVVRGNHYHESTQELFFILGGEVEVHTQPVRDGKLSGDVSKCVVKGGDIFIVEPMNNHIFYVLKESTWINALSKRLDKHRPDMYRIG